MSVKKEAATVLLCLLDTYCFVESATVLRCVPAEKGLMAVVLDKTIFHPQGGGQPSDKGVIEGTKAKFIVQQVRIQDEIVLHLGVFEGEETFLENEVVKLVVDEQKRRLYARLHSAGHLLDVAMNLVIKGQYKLVPGKGYHFEDSPYVEYIGTIPNEKKEEIVKQLELEANRLIESGGEDVRVLNVEYGEKVAELCGGTIPDYLPKDRACRVVIIHGNEGCPCGGTHVKNITEIGKMKITKITVRKGVTRVSYRIENGVAKKT